MSNNLPKLLNVFPKKVKAILALLIDMATLAIKLDKPLSARLFPILNKKAGEMTTFNSPCLVYCKIFIVN
ncbi:DUF711 family protein [Nostoc sp.]|uniref:DUF711 family protein n=1 Tax=Nostoc sp. TaxID=1180 RepID=UPI002FFA3190